MANKNNNANKGLKNNSKTGNGKNAKKNNNKAQDTNKKKQVALTPEQEASAAKKKLIIKITAIALAVAALVGIIIGIVITVRNNNRRLDYLNDDLSKYVSIDPSAYKNFPVSANIPEPSEMSLQNAINKIVYQYRNTEDYVYVSNAIIGVGDSVSLYYRGYTLGEDGTKNYFDGGCNFNSSKEHVLGIGSGSFIDGFEYNLIGKNASDYATLEKISDKGVDVKATDIVLVSYSVTRKDGTTLSTQKAMIDLADPNVDKIWGTGFAEYWQTNNVVVGTEVQILTEENDVYYITVSEAYRINKNETHPVLDIEAYFPVGYQEASLAGKTAHFEVFVTGVQRYEVPEFNDEFITEKLKLKAEDLADYDGETLADKYKDKLMKELWEEHEASIQDAIATVFWDHILAVAEFKKLPKGDLEDYYDNLYTQIQNAYPNYQSQFSSFDDFAIAYMGLEQGSDWRAALRSDAETSIKQKLAFYCVIRQQGFIPTDEEYQQQYNEIFNAMVESYISQTGSTEETAKKAINEMYDAEYWDMQVIFVFGMEKICGLANFTNTATK